MNTARVRRAGSRLAFYMLVAALVSYIVFPFYWLIVSSLKTSATFLIVDYWPRTASLSNYAAVAADPRFLSALSNSIVITAGTVGLTLLLGSAAGYAIGRLRFRGRRPLQTLLIWMAAFPPFVLLGGLYSLTVNPCTVVGGRCPQLSLYDTRLGLILTNLLLTLPLAIWFLAAYYRNLPTDLEDAAYVDGATPLQAWYQIILPVSLPGLVSVGVLTFITAWNEFLFARALSKPGGLLTITTLIASYGFDGFGAVLTLAASVLVLLPVLVLTLVFQRQLTTGLVGVELATEPMRDGRARWRDRLGLPAWNPAVALLVLVLGLGVWAWQSYGRRVISFPYPVNYGEGPLLDQALRLARGQNIYQADLSASPWTIANYPPLYVLLQAPLTRLFGPAYWYGRLIAWLSSAVAAVFVSMISLTLTRDRLAAVGGGATLLIIPYVSAWSPLARIDALALALSLGGLWLVVRWPWRPAAVAASALLLTAAVYTRQSYGLAAPLAALIWLLWSRPRHALSLAAGLALLGGGLFALLNLLTGGGFFTHIVTANINAYRWDVLQMYLRDLTERLPVLLLGSGLFVLLGAVRRGPAWRLIAPYWLGAALSALTIGKIGSDINYLLELSAAISLATAALIAWARPRSTIGQLALVLLAFQLAALLVPSRYHTFVSATIDDPGAAERLQTIVQQADGSVLADEAMGLLPLVGRRIELQPFEMTQLARAGRWDQTPLLQAIAQQRYATILIFRVPGIELERERWTDEMLDAIEQHYQPGQSVGLTTVYVPRSR